MTTSRLVLFSMSIAANGLARLIFTLVFAISAAVASAAGTVEKFNVDGKPVTLKVPDTAAAGKPWLWVGEFGGHLNSLEDGLVEKGWHVVYVGVSNQFGSRASMEVWEKLYVEMHDKRALSAKPALLGISRGGLYVNAWMRLHPDRASVLYLDNAVGDIRSWPGGFQLNAKGKGSPKDWELYKTVFQFESDEAAQKQSLRPIDGLQPAVKNGVFLISVHGTADTVVPFVDNAGPIVDFWQANGGRFKTFPKEGGDHHPHGLPDPKPLIDLLIQEAK